MIESLVPYERARAKQQVEASFFRLVQGQEATFSENSASRDLGQKGRWLQSRLAEDLQSPSPLKINGFSIHLAASKVTIGDWNPSKSLFLGGDSKISREQFLRTFGVYRPTGGFWSWSGAAFPKLNEFNSAGQIVVVEPDQGVHIIYDPHRDQAGDRDVPWDCLNLQPGTNVVLATWSMARIEELLTRKYEPHGWAQIDSIRGSMGFDSIRFGAPVRTADVIEGLQKGLVLIDSGMTSKSSRNRFLWRGSRRFWNLTEDRD